MSPVAASSRLVLVPPDLGPDAARMLGHAWADLDVAVLIERRRGDRRGGHERRTAVWATHADRRRVTLPAGRRAGELRAALVPRALDLRVPWRLRRHRRRIVLVERCAPDRAASEQAASVRDLVAMQGGDAAAIRGLYERWFDRLHAYIRFGDADPNAAVELAQSAFARVLLEAPRYDFGGPRFAVQLFGWLHAGGGALLDEGAGEPGAAEPERLSAERLGWVSDADMLVLAGRLPAPERRVLLLRHVVGLEPAEVGALLDVDRTRALELEHAALAGLGQRLAGLGRAPACDGSRIAMRELGWHSPVLRSRGRALAVSSY